MSLVSTPDFSMGFWIMAGVMAALLLFGVLTKFVGKVA